MKRWICFIFPVLFALTGCSFLGKSRDVPDSDYYFYHIDETKTELVKVAYEPNRETTENMIQDFMQLLNSKVHEIGRAHV